MDRLPLTHVPTALRPILGDATPSYRAVHHAALSAIIPAEQGHNGRWSVLSADLARIADTFRFVRRRSTIAA